MIDRRFIDWAHPALPEVVRALIAERTRHGFTDLSDVVVVTPGARAGRRFLELLAELTEGRNAPPRTLTPGQLPELLYEPQRPFADELTQELAWVEALRGAPADQLRRMIGEPPKDADIPRWLGLGKMLSRLHRELAADRLGFGEVARSPLIKSASEGDRWEALHAIQEAYHRRLDELLLWDKQTARLVAVDREECRTDSQIVLVGAVDMNRTLRGMLDQIADRVIAFVHAPESLAERFDSYGVLIPEMWQEFPLDLPDEMLQFVDGPGDQAAAVVAAVAALDGQRRVDEILVGVADETLASPIRAALDERGIATRWIGHRTLGDSLPFTLLEAIADWLEDDRTANTATLFRHPQVFAWLSRQSLPADWLTRVDDEIAEKAPRQLGRGKSSESSISRKAADLIERWLSPLRQKSELLGEWLEPVTKVLGLVYEGVSFDPERDVDRESRAALGRLLELLEQQGEVPEQLSFATTAAVALRLVLETAATEPAPPAADADAIEMLGWLELPLDDSPVMIVAGFNEGSAPSSLNHDPFLPNALREQLGLEDNRRRYARDAYATCVLRHSRPSLTLTIGRRTSSGDPLLPSRLLFATDPEGIARRVLSLLQPKPEVVPAAADDDAPRPAFGFRIPRPRRPPGQPLRLSVTAFADYLACPYRYYLKHIERLGEVDSASVELNPLTFGSLLHRVFENWAQGPMAASQNADDLCEFLNQALDGAVREMLDDSPLPAVRLQLEQARLRLKGFAAWQAKWASEGWRVHRVEADVSCSLPIDAERSVLVRGRIDRIDYHPDNHSWAIFDYKTGEAGNWPEKTHRKHKQWVDLQLPLYRRMAKSLGVEGEPRLGYIVLPKAAGSTRDAFADWSLEELEEADELAVSVARKIANGEFWPPVKDPERLMEFNAICLEGIFGREEAL